MNKTYTTIATLSSGMEVEQRFYALNETQARSMTYQTLKGFTVKSIKVILETQKDKVNE